MPGREIAYLVSYRDPNLEKTNEIFEKSVDYTESFEVSERDMTKYIIGTVSSMDTPLTPSAKGARSMSAWMTGLSFQEVQKERDEVLSCGCAEIRGPGALSESDSFSELPLRHRK